MDLLVTEKRLSLMSRREYISAMRERYLACKKRKTRKHLLDEIVALTG